MDTRGDSSDLQASTIATAKRFEDLLHSSAAHPQYAFDQIFSTDGYFGRRLSKKRFKILKTVDPVLRKMLYEDEVVDFLTTGVENYLVDQIFLGWLMYYLNRSVIVFTTHRIIVLRVRSNFAVRDIVKQVRFDAIFKLTSTFFGNTKIQTKDRKSRVFVRIPKADRKFMRDTINELANSTDATDSGVQTFEDLCPFCYLPETIGSGQCRHCSSPFKSPSKAQYLSLLFPGLGDWYLGHRRFALLEMFGASMWWLGLIGIIVDDSDPEFAVPWWPDGAVLIAIGLIFWHGLDALLTRRVARAGIYPA
jgi:hypothetical protein